MFGNKKTTCFSAVLRRRAAFAIAPVALILGLTGIAQAQEEIEEVVVTGTRREGVSPTETLSPVDVISGKTIAEQASFDMTESLSKLTPSLNTQRFPIADGTAFVRPVTLRNLAPDQTLVLVNGTRRHRSALVNLQIAPLGTVNQGSQAVDFAAFPSAAFKRVEILRDGASAQYGSDAIAGVINLILNDANEGFSVGAQYGSYSAGDGDRLSVYGNAGFALGSEGFLNVTAEYSTSEITSRGNARPDAAAVADIVGADLVAYNGFGQRWGDPDVEAVKLAFNAGIDISDKVELFANGTYMDNTTVGGFFYRGPVLDPSEMISARTTLQIDNDLDFLPDAAPQSLVDSITNGGLNPADYLTTVGDVPGSSSPSGWVLRNPIHTQFPGGYSPLFGADISDYALVIGARGEIGNGFSWDLRGRVAENEVKYKISDTINPSLGRLSPTTFNPGTLTQQESGVNLDMVKTFDDSPLNVGFGLEWRNETYKIGAGDPASIAVGPTFAQFGLGSDGFQGFGLEQAGSFDKNSIAAYVDVETDITDRLSGAVAVRYEDHDGFSSTTDFKVSARYEFTDTFALRGTVNSGFRVPTPGQVHTLNVTTSADTSGNLIPSGTYPVDHPVSQALGSAPLTTEESLSFTVGAVWQPLDNASITLDFYSISVDDRIGLLSTTVDQAAVDTLIAAGFPNATLLLGSAANYFNNGFDSDVTGVDLAWTSDHELASGVLIVDFRHSYNKQEVKNIKAGTINASRAFDLENQVPNNNSILSLDYARGPFGGLLRFNYYGDWETTGGLFSPGDASDVSSYSGKTLVDLEARYTLNDMFTFTIGGDNIFDTFPDSEKDGVLGFLGVEYAVTSPFGANGAFWYARVSAAF